MLVGIGLLGPHEATPRRSTIYYLSLRGARSEGPTPARLAALGWLGCDSRFLSEQFSAGLDEVVDRAANLLIGQTAYETARRLCENEHIDFRDGARVVARSDGEPDRR
jgi:hypothetical protein